MWPCPPEFEHTNEVHRESNSAHTRQVRKVGVRLCSCPPDLAPLLPPATGSLSFAPPKVGGLVRGVRPQDLAALIARALPDGVVPTAEIMRDQSTGIERGFGYVTVPAREGAKAGAERAISAYDGTR